MPSAVIASFRYLDDRRELEVTFRSGRVYVYLDVPLDAAEAMRAAFSKGEYFNAHIRNAYTFRRSNGPSRGTPEPTARLDENFEDSRDAAHTR